MVKHQKNDPFRVMEIFPTLQGEGTDLGRETIFLRLYGCNLACVWCDTSHSWDETQYFEGIYQNYSQVDLASTVIDLTATHDITHMVITGGEPLLHNHEALINLIGSLKGIRHVTFETNGTILPQIELAKVTGLFSISPKLSSSKNPPYNPALIDKWINRVVDVNRLQFKFVIANQQDADEVAEILAKLESWHIFKIPIIFQPEESAGNYTELPFLIKEAFSKTNLEYSDYNIRYIPQVHKLYGIR